MMPYPFRLALEKSHFRKELAMAEKSRIRLNPTTREIEIEGTEQFIKKYFDIIHNMFLGSRASEPVQKATETVKARKRADKPAGRPSKTGSVIKLIQGSKKGITTTELEKKTGLSAKRIWAIVYRAEKSGKIKKAGRGLYIAA